MPRIQKIKPEGYDKAFPQSLRNLLAEKGTTKKELAAHLNKSGQAISYYCDGSSSPDWETIVEIAKFFSVPTDYLLGLTADPAPAPSAVDELGLSAEAVRYLRTLHEVSKIPPYETKRLSLLSYLLGDRRFDWLLTKFVWYVDLKSRKTDNSFWGTPDYELCNKTLMAHGYAVSTPEVQADALFSELIIPKLRELLTEAAEPKGD